MGAPELNMRAMKLHHPIEVAANITGKSDVCEIYTVVKAVLMPNLAARISTRKALLAWSSSPPTAITMPATDASIREENSVDFAPNLEKSRPPEQQAIISLI